MKEVEEVLFKALYHSKKRQAKARHIAWQLSEEKARELFSSNCAYCNKPPSNTFRLTNKNSKRLKDAKLLYSSLDRVDSSEGYSDTSVVSCCIQCNSAKRDTPVEEFKAWAMRLANHLRGDSSACLY